MIPAGQGAAWPFEHTEPTCPRTLVMILDVVMLLTSLGLLHEWWTRFSVASSSGGNGFPASDPGLMALTLFFFTLWIVTRALMTARIRVRFDGQHLHVRAGPMRRVFPVTDIVDVGVRAVDPLANFGGWGWRYVTGVGWAAVGVNGKRAVRLTLRDGRPFTIAVEAADELAARLQAALAQR